MDAIWTELVIVLLLIVANGFFAGAELAIVSVRRSRIAQLAAAGDRRARIVEQLHSDPHRFLATVQIGVTLIGTMASAVGGAAAVEFIKPVLQGVPLPLVSNAAEPLALLLVVGCIAYLSLILGELVPKALALEYAERIALAVARPIQLLARASSVAVSVLTLSSRSVLALLGIKGEGRRAFITKEEIQHLVAEGRETGTVTPGEQELVQNVFAFSQTRVREVMVPRPRVVGLDLAQEPAALLQLVLDSKYSRYPVYRADLSNALGFIHGKDLLGRAVQAAVFELEDLVRPAFFVPEAKRAHELLREMQRRRLHMALVVDEYGSVSGIVTTEDLLEELVGKIGDEHDLGEPPRVQRLQGGGYLVDALISLGDLEELLGVNLDRGLPCDTLAGLILLQLGHLPAKGEQVAWENYLLTCTKVTSTAIRRVRIEPRPQPPAVPAAGD